MESNEDRKKLGACVTSAAEVYGREVSNAVLKLWWELLKGYDIKAVEQAFGRHMASPDAGQFMPKPADIIRMIGGTSIDSAMVAWGKVERAVRLVGPYWTVTFDDPITMRVLQDMGGWELLNNTKTQEAMAFVGNEFRTRYHGYRSRGEVPEFPVALPGIFERENGDRTDWKLIGDEAKCRQLIETGVATPGGASDAITTYCTDTRLPWRERVPAGGWLDDGCSGMPVSTMRLLTHPKSVVTILPSNERGTKDK